MKLQSIRLFSFQSFGPEPTELPLNDITYLIGPNGSGKTAALQALCRLFAFDPRYGASGGQTSTFPMTKRKLLKSGSSGSKPTLSFPNLKMTMMSQR